MAAAVPASALLADPLLRDVPALEGFKVLAGVVLYAKVGQGGMGVVYRGRHALLDVDMAVKCLKPALIAEDARFVQRFVREAQVAAHITHQNVVRLYQCATDAGLHCLLMEFVDGESVRDRVVRKGPLPEAEALAILLGAAQGLAEAHRAGLVHRDVKPDNLLVARDGRVKVADLGLVKRDRGGGSAGGDSLGSGIMGTPQYMAPEQWDTPDVAAAADVWALGATAWFMLAGEHALAAATTGAFVRRVQEQDFPDLRARRPEVRPEVHTLLARCVRRAPGERFADARALVEALLPLVPPGVVLADDGAGVATRSGPLATPPPRAVVDRIRDVLGTGTAQLGSDVVRSEAPTVPSPRSSASPTSPGSGIAPASAAAAGAPRRGPRVLLAAALVLAALGGGVAWYGLEHAWFGADPQWAEAERTVRARALWQEAQELLPLPDRVDDAIAKLEELLVLQPELGVARERLALALDRRAERLATSDLDAAFAASARAVELHPGAPAARARHDALRRQLAGRLTFGIDVRTPAAGAVVEGQRVPIVGKVAGGLREVRVAAYRVGDAMPEPRVVPVIGGEFTVEATVSGPGPFQVVVSAEDRHGVRGAALPRRAVATGAAGAPNWVQDVRANPQPIVWNAAGITMRPVPGGTFLMGSMRLEDGRDDDELQHEVTLTEPFWLGETEVTRAQWRRLMGTTPWTDDSGAEAGAEPATHVTWSMANAFCERLGERERSAGRLPAGYGYCLPTEAQWERGARAGSTFAFAHGPDEAGLAEHAVFGGSAPAALPVALRAANAFALFDTAGNVAEWCADLALVDAEGRVTTLVYRAGAVEPLGDVGPVRLVRGGHFGAPAVDCRCAARAARPADTADATLGFRVALAKR